jgi:hypothetical protein
MISYGIPDLQFNNFTIDFNFLCAKLDAHGGITVVGEPVIIVGGNQTSLTYRGISNENVLENIVHI